jgi:phosphate transport system protein
MQRKVFTWAHLEIPRHVETTQAVIDVLSIARALERIADLSTNIAEDVIFLVEGSVVRHTKE